MVRWVVVMPRAGVRLVYAVQAHESLKGLDFAAHAQYMKPLEVDHCLDRSLDWGLSYK